MELKPGYKMTEVGVIPEDWGVVPLDTCVQTSAPICYGILMPGSDCNGGVPVIKVKDIINGRIEESGLLLAHPSIDEAYKRSRLSPNDLLVTIRGTTGRVAIVPPALDNANITQDTARVRIKEGIDIRFIYFALQSDLAQHQIALHTIGQAVKGINIRDVKRLIMVSPPTDKEQRAIAEALSDADNLIEALDRLIAKKRDLKQAAMQELLTGKTRLPGFGGEWEVKRLGEVAEMSSGGTPTSSIPAYYDGDIPWVSITDMTKSGKVLTATDRNLTSLGFANSATQMFPVGTVLYAMYASLGECSIAGIEVCSSQAILGIRPTKDLSNEFLYYYLVSLKPTIKSLGQQGTQANLNKGMVQNFQIHLPPLSEQTAIAEVLSDMDGEIAALEARRDKTRALKQGMMAELLTGKTRLL